LIRFLSFGADLTQCELLQDVPLESSRIWYRLAEGDPSSADDSNAPKPLFGFPAGGSRPEQVDVEICTPMKKLVMSTSNLSKSSSQSVVHTGGRQGHETLEAIGLCSADYILVETKLHVLFSRSTILIILIESKSFDW
jgi:hypothetical protein